MGGLDGRSSHGLGLATLKFRKSIVPTRCGTTESAAPLFFGMVEGGECSWPGPAKFDFPF